MANLMPDIRLALRLMRKSPGFTIVAVAALALGIGANSAIFSVVNAVLLRPLPYPHSERIGILWENSPSQGWNLIGPSGADFIDFKEQSKSFEDIALLEPGTGTVSGFGEPQQVPGLRVSTNFLSSLGYQPVLGRDFLATEGFENRVVILSNNAWLRWFGGDRAAIGRRLILDGIAYTCIGVMPANLWLPVAADAFVPWSENDLRGRRRMQKSNAALVRLKPGVSWKEASSELTTIMSRIAVVEPRMKGWGAYVAPLKDWMASTSRQSLLLLLGAVGLVLLIACTNLANLMLARAAAREREIAIRTALGASRTAIVRQLLTETMILGLIGGALGLLLSLWGIDLLNRLSPATIHVPDSNAYLSRPSFVIDGTVLGFTMLASLLTGILFGVAPAFSASRTNANETLKQGGRQTGSTQARRLRGLLVVAEVALALVLLVSAGLTIKSFWKMQQVQPGFTAGNVLVMQTELPTDSKYKTDPEQTAFFRRVLENIEQLPGVSAVGLTCGLPMDEDDHQESIAIEGRPLPPSGQLLPVAFRSVSEGYFSALGIPLKRGRYFTAQDTADRPRVAVIDETFAERYWPAGVEGAQDPIGQKLRAGRDVLEIVGIVGEVHNAGLDKRPQPTVYATYRQDPEPRMTFVVRHPDPRGMINSVKNAIYSVDKDQPVYKVRTMTEVVSGSTASSRFTLVLLMTFALVAMALASIGIYGVMSYTVTQRTTEIGIRIALGAGTGDVLGMVVRQGMTLAGLGIAIGLAASLGAGQVMSALLFGVSPSDPTILCATAVVLGLVALLATYLPARRASRTAPIISLRYQ